MDCNLDLTQERWGMLSFRIPLSLYVIHRFPFASVVRVAEDTESLWGGGYWLVVSLLSLNKCCRKTAKSQS